VALEKAATALVAYTLTKAPQIGTSRKM
jgi:hypothetical protein